MRRALRDWPIVRADQPVSAGEPLVTVVDGHPHTLAFLGRVNWKKGLDRVISILPRLPQVRFAIAGNDEDRPVVTGPDVEPEGGAGLVHGRLPPGGPGGPGVEHDDLPAPLGPSSTEAEGPRHRR